jgi:ketosteroid isomerase-like protein
MQSMNFRPWNIGVLLLLSCVLSVVAADAQSQTPPPPPPSPPAAETLHNELRALRDQAVAAVNKRDADSLMQVLDPNITFTAMNNDVVHGLEQAKAYYQRMLVGSGRIVEEMSLTVVPDELTGLYENGTIGISAGSSVAHFKLATGSEFDVPLRWTATLHRSNDKWSILSLHYSANMFDNPILDALKSSIKWIVLGVGIISILVGFFVGRWSRKRSA